MTFICVARDLSGVRDMVIVSGPEVKDEAAARKIAAEELAVQPHETLSVDKI